MGNFVARQYFPDTKNDFVRAFRMYMKQGNTDLCGHLLRLMPPGEDEFLEECYRDVGILAWCFMDIRMSLYRCKDNKERPWVWRVR